MAGAKGLLNDYRAALSPKGLLNDYRAALSPEGT
jgi:hypothetical protein